MSSKLVRLVLLLKCLLTCASADIDILYKKDVCEEKEFYSPYVRLLKTRQPNHGNSPMAKLYSPGYISLTKYTGVLCINGPAIVYSDVIKDPKCGKDWILSNGEPQLFSHDCFTINRLAREAYKKPDRPEMAKDSNVFGNKVFGVYLLGQSPDYRFPSFAFYPGNFAYIPGNLWCVGGNGASVAFVANNSDSSAHCYSVKKYNMEGSIYAKYQGSPLFCYREDRDEEFDSPWHKGEDKPLTNEDITWDAEEFNCASLQASSPTGGEEMELEPVQLPDFRMIHPKFWSSQGSKGIMYKVRRKLGGEEPDQSSVYSRPNPPGSLFPGEPGWNDGSNMARVEKVLREGDIDAVTAEPVQKFQVEVSSSDCEELPEPPETCDRDLGAACVFINHVLTLEETNWKSDTMKDGSWRLPILNLVNSIYEKACPQVAKYLPSALSRVFQLFLSKSLERNGTFQEKFNHPQKTEWSDMITDLESCNSNAEKMVFYQKKNGAAIKFRNKLETKLSQLYERMYSRREAALQRAEEAPSGSVSSADPLESLMKTASSLTDDDNHKKELQEIEKIQHQLNEVPLKFPFKIFVGSKGSKASDFSKAQQVYQYREAAEIDHELDWALDSYWKVIVTVLGYCSGHNKSQDLATYQKLYDTFKEDFLGYITEDWMKGENRPIYDQLFGEFIYGEGTLWIDACQNGAYQWSKIVNLRPLRPLLLNDGDVPPRPVTADAAPSPPPTNFFIDNPVNSKVAGDHFHYGDDTIPETESDLAGAIPEPFLSSSDRRNGIRSAIVDSITDPLHHFS